MLLTVIFLTIRKKKPIHRKILSFFIAVFTRKKGQKLSDVKVHAAICYRKGSEIYVRDMEAKGAEHIPFEVYTERYKGRIEIIDLFPEANPAQREAFDRSCAETESKYDYRNTFVWQVLKRYTGRFFGKNTIYARMCAEDVQRQMNILGYGFDTPEETNPNELYEKIINEFI